MEILIFPNKKKMPQQKNKLVKKKTAKATKIWPIRGLLKGRKKLGRP
jgi:hypothetical protein